MSSSLNKKNLILIFSLIFLLSLLFITYLGLSYKKASIMAEQTKSFFEKIPGAEVKLIDYSFFPVAKVKISEFKMSNKLTSLFADSIEIESKNLFSVSVKIYLENGISYKVKEKSGSLKFKNPKNSFVSIQKTENDLLINYQDEGLVFTNKDKKTIADSNNKLSIHKLAEKINVELKSVGTNTKIGAYELLANLSHAVKPEAQFGIIDIKNTSFSSEKINILLSGNIKLNPYIISLDLSLLDSDKLFDFIFTEVDKEFVVKKDKIISTVREIAAKNKKTKNNNLIFKINSFGDKTNINDIKLEDIIKKF
jgi:hypothetical protein